MAGPWRRRARPGRRSGPPDEDRWWEPADQAAVERPLLHARDLGKGWQPVPMVNNVERLDPHGDDPASDAVRAARQARKLTALDEGAAWRRRRDGALLVARVEAFVDDDEAAHRAAWQANGAPSLDAVFRARWRERGREPGWIEARWCAASDRPDGLRAGAAEASEAADALDWLVVEDHIDLTAEDPVVVYEHLTLWAGRVLVTLILRHRLGEEVHQALAGAVPAAWSATRELSRRSGPARGSA